MSFTLSSSELEGMRELVSSQALPDLTEVQRATTTSDGMGGQTETWATRYRNVACRLAQPSGGEPGMTMIGKAIADRAGNRPVFVASLTAGVDVQDGDRLIVGGETYEVLMIVNGSWEISRRAMVIRLE